MAYNPFVCDGALVKVKISGSFTKIDGVFDPTFSGSQKPEIEYTAIDDNVAKKKTGRMSYGNFSFGLFFGPADTTHQYLITRANTAGTEDEFEITLPDSGAAVITFTAAIQAFDLSLKSQAMGTVQVNTTLNGAWTMTP